jgi:hypothetical protein
MEQQHDLQHTDELLDKALATTTFSLSQLKMLQAKIQESPVKNGVMTLSTTAEIDGVAVGAPYKTVAVVRDGQIHRDKGPAVVIDDLVATPDGTGVVEAKTRLYMRNGVPDREDGPAVIGANRNVLWMQQGKLHRENGPAALIDGEVIFALHGKTMSALEFGRKQGLGELDKDWFVHRQAGVVISNLGGDGPLYLGMSSLTPERGQTVQVASPDTAVSVQRATVARDASPPLPPLTGNDKQVEIGTRVREETIKAVRDRLVEEPVRAETVVQKLVQDKQFQSAATWVALSKMPLPERADGVVQAMEAPAAKKMQPFAKVLGPQL